MKDAEIKAILQAQAAMLIALAMTSVRQGALLQRFGELVSVAIESEPDPVVAGILQTLETEYRRAIAGNAGNPKA